MDTTWIISQLAANRATFEAMLRGTPSELRSWKPAPEHWSILEVVCHLRDEEAEDFRSRVDAVLHRPEAPLPPIDPQGWVLGRRYLEQDFDAALEAFITQRDRSIGWLRSLREPAWDNAHQHPKFGPMSARMLLANWLAHDYLHMRQITRRKHEFLRAHGGVPLEYAGPW